MQQVNNDIRDRDRVKEVTGRQARDGLNEIFKKAGEVVQAIEENLDDRVHARFARGVNVNLGHF